MFNEQEPLGEKTPQDEDIKSVGNDGKKTTEIIDGDQEKAAISPIETLPEFQKRMLEIKEKSLDSGSASLEEYDSSLADEIDQQAMNFLESLQTGKISIEEFNEFYIAWRSSIEASKMDGGKDPVKQNQLILAEYIANMVTVWQLNQDIKNK